MHKHGVQPVTFPALNHGGAPEAR
ncbi:hypothetical protein PENANT_c348G02044 [Penicillium antarcticum]|uniref:Uncharacterized protein n=1 Tax=Penicillium antarcticum TaxID=416450 RepID=A0A1V6NNN8_9EURO|nr:hypothetical protein PENANT_c348G02044 [Penicillium antarcticum]